MIVKAKLSWRGTVSGGVDKSSTYREQADGVDGQLINFAVRHGGQLFKGIDDNWGWREGGADNEGCLAGGEDCI